MAVRETVMFLHLYIFVTSLKKNYEIVTLSFLESQTGSFFLPFHHFPSFSFFPLSRQLHPTQKKSCFCCKELRGSTHEAGLTQAGPRRPVPVMCQETSIDVKLCPFIGGWWKECGKDICCVEL